MKTVMQSLVAPLFACLLSVGGLRSQDYLEGESGKEFREYLIKTIEARASKGVGIHTPEDIAHDVIVKLVANHKDPAKGDPDEPRRYAGVATRNELAIKFRQDKTRKEKLIEFSHDYRERMGYLLAQKWAPEGAEEIARFEKLFYEFAWSLTFEERDRLKRQHLDGEQINSIHKRVSAGETMKGQIKNKALLSPLYKERELLAEVSDSRKIGLAMQKALKSRRQPKLGPKFLERVKEKLETDLRTRGGLRGKRVKARSK